MGVSSISFPPLGCGNGNLDWNEVCPLMERFLRSLEIPVYVHDRQVSRRFVPEHRESEVERIPVSFHDFMQDIKEQIHANRGAFLTLKGRAPFQARWQPDDGIFIESAGRSALV